MIRALLDRRGDELRTSHVRDAALELGVSLATLCRLIGRYRSAGTVEALTQRSSGRPAGRRLLDARAEAIIARAIREVYLKPAGPTLKRLVDEVHALCHAASLPTPDRRTVRLRALAIPARIRALRRADFKAIKATTPVPGASS